ETVTVIQNATANAGPDASTCNTTPITLSGTATDYSSVSWTATGTGMLANATTRSPTYTPSPADVTAGSVTLTLTAFATTPCTTNASDSLVLTFNSAITTAYVDDGYGMLSNGTSVDWPYTGGMGVHTIGCDAFAT